MTHDELIPFLLEKSPLFESFGRDSIETIVEGSELRTFEGNESIIQCGEDGRFIGSIGKADKSSVPPEHARGIDDHACTESNGIRICQWRAIVGGHLRGP